MKMTNFFDKTEVIINKGVDELGAFIRRTQINTNGWGSKVDAWFGDPEKWDKLKTAVKTKTENVKNTAFKEEKDTVDYPETGVLTENTKESDSFIDGLIPPAPAEDTVEENKTTEEQPLTPAFLSNLSLPELKTLARQRGFVGISTLRKQELIDLLS